MTEAFDPYHKWLGIPRAEQPPNHYRLLGVALFESDPDVIESAADRQMAHVQTHKTGKHSALSQKILNELSSAKLCLLDRKKKAAYDEQLKVKLAAAPPPAPPANVPPVPPPLSGVQPLLPSAPHMPAPVLQPGMPPPGLTPAATLAPAAVVTTPGPAPLPKATPLPAEPTAKEPVDFLVGSRGGSLASRARARRNSSLPWILGSALAALVVVALFVIVASSGGNQPVQVSGGAGSGQGTSTGGVPAGNGGSTIRPNGDGGKQRPDSGGQSNAGQTNGGNRNGGIENSTPSDQGKMATQPNTAGGAGKAPDVKNVGIETNSIGIKLAKLPPGVLQMMAPREPVPIPAPIYISVTEITQAQYQRVMGDNPSAFSEQGSERQKVAEISTDDLPVENVTWREAAVFCNKLSELEGLVPCYEVRGDNALPVLRPGNGYRLPRPEEWRYAACPSGEWHWRHDAVQWSKFAWLQEDSNGRPHAVAGKAANAFELHDLIGNVGEWTTIPNVYTGPSYETPVQGLRIGALLRLPAGAERSPTVGFRIVRGETVGSQPSPMVTDVVQNDTRHPIPSAEEQETARKLIRELFKEDYRKGTSATSPLALAKARFDLATRFFEEAKKTKDDIPALYVLLHEAEKWSAEAGVPIAALEAATKRATTFQETNPLRIKGAALAEAARNVETPAAAKAALERGIALVDELLAARELETASRLLSNLALAGTKFQANKEVADLSKQLAPVRAQVRMVERFHELADKARQTLDSMPEDASAHSTLGLYLLLQQDDLAGAIPHLLAAGGPLQAIAQLEEPPPDSPAKQVELADKWYEFASKESNAYIKQRGLMRARSFYRQAQTGLMGLTRARVERTLREIEQTLSTAAGSAF